MNVLPLMQNLPFILVGLTSVIMQIAIVRQLFGIFSGNELDIGITLSIWLTAVGLGSLAGYKIRYRNAFAWSFLCVAVLCQPLIFSANLIRPVLSLEFGETVSLPATLISTLVVLLPFCFAAGIQFPLAVSYSGGKAATVYSYEAAGAFTGGVLFTFFLAGKANAYILSAIISLLNILVLSLILSKKRLLIFLIIPIFFYFSSVEADRMLQWKGAKPIDRAESRYGELMVMKTGEQFNLFFSGKLQFSYPDIQTEELKTHLPMSVHPFPRRILVIGGSPAVIRELIKYPVEQIDFVELDPKIIEVSKRLLSRDDASAFDDKRVRIFTDDARRFVKAMNSPYYDLIISNMPEPATANINRFYTTEFFSEAASALRGSGILTLTINTSFGYMGRKMQLANGSVYNSLKKVFRDVAVSSGEYGYIFASNSPIDLAPGMLDERFAERKIPVKYFQPYILEDAFSQTKIAMTVARLEGAKAVNSDLRPVAYLYTLMLWAEMNGGYLINQVLVLPGWSIALIISAFFLALSIRSWRKKRSVYFSIFTTGYSTMAFSLIIILTYQSFYGYVYETIGLFTATFMLGVASGASVAAKIVKPLFWLRLLEFAAILLFILTTILISRDLFFYSMNFLCGAIGGAQFALANLCVEKGEVAKSAGRLYAADLAGSFLGAFLISILLMPILGVRNSLMVLAFIKGISAIPLFSGVYEKA